MNSNSNIRKNKIDRILKVLKGEKPHMVAIDWGIGKDGEDDGLFLIDGVKTDRATWDKTAAKWNRKKKD